MTISSHTPKRFLAEVGFSLLLYNKGHAVYRRAKPMPGEIINQSQYIVRRGGEWYAQSNSSGDRPDWSSPGLGSAEAALAFAEVEEWGSNRTSPIFTGSIGTWENVRYVEG